MCYEMASDIHNQHKVFAAFPLYVPYTCRIYIVWILLPLKFSHLKRPVALLRAPAALPVWR